MAKQIRKPLALVLVVMLLLSSITAGLTVFAADTNLAEWNYTANPPVTEATAKVPATGGAFASESNLSKTTSSAWTFSSQSLKADNWAENDYWQVEVPTRGYENLEITFKMRSSGTGPRDFRLQYSTDGIVFVDVESFESPSATTTLKVAGPFSLPEEANNCDLLYIRLLVSSNINMNDGQIATGGANNINNIVVSGSAVSGSTETCKPVTADVRDGARLLAGDTVRLATETEDAAIKYTLNGGPEQTYSGPIAVSNFPAVIETWAEKAGFNNSAKTTYTYEERPTTDAADPIEDQLIADEGAISIKDALANPAGTADVVGQVAYAYRSSYTNIVNSYIIQDVIDGEIVGLQLFDASNTYQIGDIVKVSGTLSEYYGVVQLSTITAVDVLDTTVAPFEPQVVTFEELTKYYDEFISEYVAVLNVTLPAHVASGSITLEDATGTMTAYHPADYPAGMEAGDVVNIKGSFSRRDAALQMRIASSDDYTTSNFVAAVTATPDSGAVDIGTSVALSTSTLGADIYYKLDGESTYTLYTAPIDLSVLPNTITAYAELGGNQSAEKTFNYTEKEPPETVYDPITDEMVAAAGAITIKDALAQRSGTAKVIGQVAYAYGSNGSINTYVIQDVIDGEIYGMQLYLASGISVGDIVVVEGVLEVYQDNLQMSNNTQALAINTIGTDTPFAPQNVTIAELKANFESYRSEYIVIRNVVLGTYGSNTVITDADGQTINIYSGAPFPDGITAGSTVNVYAAAVGYYATAQLRNGSGSDYKAVGAYDVDDSIEYPIANWALTLAAVGGYTYPIPADKKADNDFLNTNAELKTSKGAPTGTVSAGGIGAGAFYENDYYQVKIDTSKLANVQFSYQMRGSNTGPRDFTVYYSLTEAGPYTAASGVLAITKSGEYFDYSVQLPSEVANQPEVYIRITNVGTTSIDGGLTRGGTNYLRYVSVIGNPIISDEIVAAPSVTPEAGEVAVGTEVTIVNNTPNATIYYAFDGGAYQVYDASNKPIITAVPTTLSVYATKSGLDDSLVVDYDYIATRVETPKVSPNGGNIVADKEITITSGTEGATIYYTTSLDNHMEMFTYDNDNKPSFNEAQLTGGVTMRVWGIMDGYTDSEVKVVTFGLRTNEKYNLYFGQLHSHTNLSDGIGDVRDAFAYASNVDRLDFLAVTDHSNSLETTAGTATIEDGSSSSKWVQGKAAAAEVTTSDFIGLYAYEMTWSDKQIGHINTFNTGGFQNRNEAQYKASNGLQTYYDVLKTQTESISQFNHPGDTFGRFHNYSHYDAEIDELITMIEVGNGEGAITSGEYYPSYKEYTTALDKGWHVGPTNNQDNHKGKWGDSNTARTVIMADSLSEEDIYDALRNRRVYATEDNNLQIYYTLNDLEMGSIISEAEKPEAVNLKVELTDHDNDLAGAFVEVVVNGGMTAASRYVTNATSETMEFELAQNYSYYFIRVTKAQGEIAVTAPVWVGDSENIGIDSTTASTVLPIQDEEFTVTTSFYNNEKKNVNFVSLEYYTTDADGNETVVHTADVSTIGKTGGKLSSMEDAEYSFPLTVTQSGIYNLNVRLILEVAEDVERVYTDTLSLNITHPSLVSKIVIDGSHENDYVSGGNYAGSVKNFEAVVAAEQVQVTVAMNITAEVLADADAFVITAPAKTAANVFTTEFVQLVKDFVDNGGLLILCGTADYSDRPALQTSVEMNKILSAIGADIEVLNDQAVDDINKVNEAYRLAFTNIDTDNEFTQGIVTKDMNADKHQKYSHYSGCTVKVGPNATALVRGHDTTYSNDTKTNGNTNNPAPVLVPQGDVVSLATEELVGGGKIIVAGTAFISDFEVSAEIDNNDDLPYANYTIAQNIAKSIKKDLEVTDIVDVWEKEEGEVYAVEGIITAGTETGISFFDSGYVQDATGGINIYPLGSYDLKQGQKVKVLGQVSSYQGEKQLNVINVTILDESINKVEPIVMTTGEAADFATNHGWLIKTEGTVKSITYEVGKVSSFQLDDGTGETRIFINGYIDSSTGESIVDNIAVGDKVSAIGLVSYEPEGERIRVRDRAEIEIIEKAPALDWTELDKLIADIAAADYSAYTEESVTAYIAAVKAIDDAVRAKADATQADIDAAVKAIKDLDLLKEKPANPDLDWDKLIDLMDEIMYADYSKYTDESVDAYLEAVLDRFVDVWFDEDATQDDIDKAIEDIKALSDMLVLKELVTTPPTTKPDGEGNGNGGGSSTGDSIMIVVMGGVLVAALGLAVVSLRKRKEQLEG